MKIQAWAALALLVLTLAGCSTDRNELIRVGNRVVTVEEFKAVAKGNESQYLGTPDQAKAALFEDLLRRSLLLHEADQRGLFRDTVVAGMRSAAEDRLLTEAIYQRLSPARIDVSDAEVARAISWRDTACHLLLIYTPSRAPAYAAAAELRGGASFAEVATRFNPPGRMPPGGDFGFLVPGSMVAPIDGLMRTVPIGETLGPIESPGEGWFVMRVVAREYRPMGPPETQVTTVRDMLRQRKRRISSLRAYNDIKQAYGYRIEPGAGAIVYSRANRINPQLDGMGQSLAPGAGEGDETQVLARWDDGGIYRLSDAVADLDGESRPPDLTNAIAIEYWIEQRVMRRVGLIEARRRQLHLDPDIRRRVDGAVDNHVLQVIYEQDVAAEAQLFPLDVRGFYETTRGDFQKLDEVTVQTVTFADSAVAQAVMMHAGHAPDMAAALAMAGATAPIETEVVRYPTTDGKWEMLSAAFMSVQPGQSVGPIRTPRGWEIARLIAKKQRVAEFDELEPALRQVVEQQAEEKRRDDALRKVTQHLRNLYQPVLHPERLSRIPWPIEPVGPPS